MQLSVPQAEAYRSPTYTGLQRITLRRMIRAGLLEAEEYQAGRGVGYHVDAAALDALPSCSFPTCSSTAGPSGRCGAHAAKAELDTLELICQHCGTRFTRPGSWLREREGRGRYCSDRCKGLAGAAANPGRLQVLNPAGASEHHAQVDDHVRDAGRLTSTRAAAELGISRQWLIGRHEAGQVDVIKGTTRRTYTTEELQNLERDYARGGDGRRRSWLEPEHAVARLRARGIVLTLDEADQVREAVRRRRRVLQRLSSGRPRMGDVHERWQATADSIAAESPELGWFQVIDEAFTIDWQEHPETWPRDRYPAAAWPDLPHRRAARKGRDRMLKHLVRPAALAA